MNSALLSSKKMDYCTPQGFFDTPETDGLTAPWNIGGGAACFATRRMAGHWARGCAKPMRRRRLEQRLFC